MQEILERYFCNIEWFEDFIRCSLEEKKKEIKKIVEEIEQDGWEKLRRTLRRMETPRIGL